MQESPLSRKVEEISPTNDIALLLETNYEVAFGATAERRSVDPLPGGSGKGHEES